MNYGLGPGFYVGRATGARSRPMPNLRGAAHDGHDISQRGFRRRALKGRRRARLG